MVLSPFALSWGNKNICKGKWAQQKSKVFKINYFKQNGNNNYYYYN